MSIDLDVTVTAVDHALLVGTRPRIIGKNSQKDTHGQYIYEPVIRIHTDSGVTGWGWSKGTKTLAKSLLGKKVSELFDLDIGTKQSYLDFDFPIWDLVGRLLSVSVHELLGNSGDATIPIYDGSIYIDEIDIKTGRDEGVGPILNAVRMGSNHGFRDFKIKVGRSFKWMKGYPGIKRDIEVIRSVRDLIGPESMIAIDANNGYTFQEIEQVLLATEDCDIYWIEEPFHESLGKHLELHQRLKDLGLNLLIADGEYSEESTESVNKFTELVKTGAVDVVQFDMLCYSLSKWKQYMTVVTQNNVLISPHSFGSYLAGFYIAQFGLGVGRLATVEMDIMSMHCVESDKYTIREGNLEVPDCNGFGLVLDHKSFDKEVLKSGWELSL